MSFIVPMIDEFDIQRADLSLGLRRATRYYSELVAPGIGGAWRVRHFSWAVAGIYMDQVHIGKNRLKSMTIANAIEALGNKTEWDVNKDPNGRVDFKVLGIQAFKRNPDEWEFAKLRQKNFYVQITHRQRVTRALPQISGLGFTEASSRFNGMQLTHIGREFAESFLNRPGLGSGRPRLLKNLQDWIDGKFDAENYIEKLHTLISPVTPCENEQDKLLARLRSIVIGQKDQKRRERLVDILEKNLKGEQLPTTNELIGWIRAKQGGQNHAEDIYSALYFEEMRDSAVRIISSVARMFADEGNSLQLANCVKNEDVMKAVSRFRVEAKRFLSTANGHTDALRLARAEQLDDFGLLTFLLRRVGHILILNNNVITKGSASLKEIQNRHIVDDLNEFSMIEGRPNRLYQFISLWRDCQHA